MGFPREIFINNKTKRFALIALVYWDTVYMKLFIVSSFKDCSFYLGLNCESCVHYGKFDHKKCKRKQSKEWRKEQVNLSFIT